MAKRKRIIYWITTLWLALGILSSGIVQLIQANEEVYRIRELGYPVYFLGLLGIWKILAVVALLMPRSPLLKEWAYAGLFFAMSGAVFSHLASGNRLEEAVPSLLLLMLTLASWYLRPTGRKMVHFINGKV